MAVEVVVTHLWTMTGKNRRRRGEVEDPVERDPRLLVEFGGLLGELLVDRVVVEGPGHVAHPLEQPVEHLLVGVQRENRLIDSRAMSR